MSIWAFIIRSTFFFLTVRRLCEKFVKCCSFCGAKAVAISVLSLYSSSSRRNYKACRASVKYFCNRDGKTTRLPVLKAGTRVQFYYPGTCFDLSVYKSPTCSTKIVEMTSIFVKKYRVNKNTFHLLVLRG